MRELEKLVKGGLKAKQRGSEEEKKLNDNHAIQLCQVEFIDCNFIQLFI